MSSPYVFYEDLKSFNATALLAPLLLITTLELVEIHLGGFIRKQSSIRNAGFGVFTACNIKAHEFLMEYPGKISTDEIQNGYGISFNENGTSFYCNVQKPNSMAHFINSLDVPNCVFVITPSGTSYHISIISLVSLSAGQELFLNYYLDFLERPRSSRLSDVLILAHVPKAGDKGVTLFVYGKSKKRKFGNGKTSRQRYVAAKWVRSPCPRDEIWAMSAATSKTGGTLFHDEASYFLEKQTTPACSYFLVTSHTGDWGRKDRKKISPLLTIDSRKRPNPMDADFALMASNKIFKRLSGDIRGAVAGVCTPPDHFYSCCGTSKICVCDEGLCACDSDK